MKKLLLILITGCSTTAFAEEQKTAPVDPLAAETLWRVFGSLGLILVAIFGLVWLLRRSGTMTRGRSGKMQVVDVLSLGQRERLVLVSVGGQQLLLGVAPGRVQAVHTIDTPYEEGTDSSASRFADVLRLAKGDKKPSEEGGQDA